RCLRQFCHNARRVDNSQQSFAVHYCKSPPMSALPPKADIIHGGGKVRFVPKTDIRNCTRERAAIAAAFAYSRGVEQHVAPNLLVARVLILLPGRRLIWQ